MQAVTRRDPRPVCEVFGWLSGLYLVENGVKPKVAQYTSNKFCLAHPISKYLKSRVAISKRLNMAPSAQDRFLTGIEVPTKVSRS